MNFADEEYRKLYVRDTVTWDVIGWQARCVLPLALRKFDNAGVLEFGKHGAARVLASVIDIPLEVVEPGLEALLREEVWIIDGDRILWPTFMDGQAARRSDRLRQRMSRARRKSQPVTDTEEPVTNCDDDSDNRDNCHTQSRSVTPREREGNGNGICSSSEGSPEGEPTDPSLTPAQRQELSFAEPKPEARALFDAWQSESGKTGAQYDFHAREFFERIVRDGVTPEIVTQVTRGAKLDDYARNTGRLAFRLLLKDSAQREKYLEIERSPPSSAKPKRTPPQPNNTANPYKLNVQRAQ